MSTRECILQNALRLFSLRGYDAVGVQEIVNESQITKPTLYHYFGSKKGLFAALLEEYYGDFLRRVEEASSYSGDIHETLDRLAQVFFSYAMEHREFFRLKLTLDFLPPDNEVHSLAMEYNGMIFSRLEAMFLAASGDHGNMRGRHGIHAVSLIGLLHTYVSLYLNGYSDLSDDVRRQFLTYFKHGIFS